MQVAFTAPLKEGEKNPPSFHWMGPVKVNGRVLRVREGGAVTDVVTVDRNGAYACMLGGEDRTTLFVCTADSSHPDETGTMRGAIEVCEVDVPGAGLP